MSEQEDSENKRPKSKFPKKPNMPKSPFSFYWIYGIIAVALIAMQMMTSFGGGLEEVDAVSAVGENCSCANQHAIIARSADQSVAVRSARERVPTRSAVRVHRHCGLIFNPVSSVEQRGPH